jgi:hypothetical protein
VEIIRKIPGAKNAEVKVVKIDEQLWVHKKQNVVSAQNEKAFYKELEKNNLPFLEILDHPALQEDEILIEYIENSPTLSETSDDYESWGHTLRKLHNITFSKATLLRDNQFINLDINSYYLTELNRAKELIINCKYHTKDEANLIISYLKNNLLKLPLSFCLVHGDMHSANVLKREREIILFDKSSSQWSFTPLIDLAIVMLDIPNGFLVNTNLPDYRNDAELRKAFLKGYGSVNLNEVKLFSQFQAASRINNSNEPLNIEIVKSILN